MVQLGQSLEPQPEPQPQPSKLIKQCQQGNKRNNCGASFDKTDKICILWGGLS